MYTYAYIYIYKYHAYIFRYLHIYVYIYTSKIQKTCASGIRKITTGRYDDGGDGTATMCRRPDDDSSEARRRCADGTTTIDRRHDHGDMTTRPRRCDDGATTVTSPGLTCHISLGSATNPLYDMLGWTPNPGL